MAINANRVSAGSAMEVLRVGWAAQEAGQLTASWMLHGRPGVGKTDGTAILFLGELTAASPSLQLTVYGLLQERRVGRNKLPDSAFIVTAGHTLDDGAVAYEMGTALSDRLVHIVVQADLEDWLKLCARKAEIHPTAAAFQRTRPDLFETTEAALRRGEAVAARSAAYADHARDRAAAGLP